MVEIKGDDYIREFAFDPEFIFVKGEDSIRIHKKKLNHKQKNENTKGKFTKYFINKRIKYQFNENFSIECDKSDNSSNYDTDNDDDEYFKRKNQIEVEVESFYYVSWFSITFSIA